MGLLDEPGDSVAGPLPPTAGESGTRLRAARAIERAPCARVGARQLPAARRLATESGRIASFASGFSAAFFTVAFFAAGFFVTVFFGVFDGSTARAPRRRPIRRPCRPTRAASPGRHPRPAQSADPRRHSAVRTAGRRGPGPPPGRMITASSGISVPTVAFAAHRLFGGRTVGSNTCAADPGSNRRRSAGRTTRRRPVGRADGQSRWSWSKTHPMSPLGAGDTPGLA